MEQPQHEVPRLSGLQNALLRECVRAQGFDRGPRWHLSETTQEHGPRFTERRNGGSGPAASGVKSQSSPDSGVMAQPQEA